MGKCPKCEKLISSVKINPIEGRVGTQAKLHCLAYCCPYCSTVLSVEIDPIAIKTDMVNELRGKR